jgi:hypothetical protein
VNESIIAFILFIFAFEILLMEILFERTSKRLEEIEEIVERLRKEDFIGE